MRISVAEGNRRPHDLVQAAKFASEVGVVVKKDVPILTHWKEYKGGEARRHLLHKIYEKTKCMYGYPLLTFNSTLSNFNGFTFHSHYCV
jgi:hypothetical protein